MKIGLRAYNPVDVDLGGAEYQTVDLPQSAAKRFQELMDEMSSIGDTDEDEQRAVDYMLEGFDLILSPSADGTPKASVVLREGIDSGGVTPRQFISLWTDVLSAIEQANGTDEVEGAVDRPT